MKIINFLNTLSPNEQKKIAVWYRVAVWTLVIVLGSLLSVHAWQWRTLYALRDELQRSSLSGQLAVSPDNDYEKIRETHHRMTECSTMIDHVIHHVECAAHYIESSVVGAGNDIRIASCSYAHNGCRLAVHAPNVEQALTFFEYFVQHSGCIGANIISLHTGNFDGKKTVMLEICASPSS